MTSLADLQRRVVAFLEGRRSAELANLIARHNGIPVAAPSLREVHAPDSPILQDSIHRVLDSDLDTAIFLTAAGTATVFDAVRAMHRESDLREKLESAIVVVRGPKPSVVLRKLGVRIDVSAPPPHTSAEILSVLQSVDLRDKTVCVQLYGEPNPVLSQTLTGWGARVVELAPYVWDQPVDPGPILHLLDCLDRSEIDALLITSQAQVDNLFDIAHQANRIPSLNGVAIGAQGPVVEAALVRRGLSADFTPEHGHMGSLVLAAANYLSLSTQRWVTDPSQAQDDKFSQGVFAQ